MKIRNYLRLIQIPRGLFRASLASAILVAAAPGQTLYEFGNPGPEEQLYIELINRARANPSAEGVRLAATGDPDTQDAYRYYNVDLTLMQTELGKLAAAPPLAPNALLTGTARSHSQWMLVNATQSHDETNPSNTFASRIGAAGYNYSAIAENIYAYVKSVEHGHAGFDVDWGIGTGGMQDPRGHRANIHNAGFREIGVGVVVGTNGSVGPQLVTQDFGSRQSSPTLATGVAYYDLNSNNFYDIGEGISGLGVNVSGATHYCATASGGGWAMPVPSSNTTMSRPVTFSGLGINQSVGMSVEKAKNAKADLKLAYSPPAITSSDTATAGSPYAVAFTAVAGATGYKWSRWTTTVAAAENCENPTQITRSTTGTYSVVNTSVKQQGAASFHLENSTGSSQWLQLSPLYFGGTSPALSFQSRIRYATTSEWFKVQIKEEGAAVWQTVYGQQGSGGSGETGFNLRNAALTGMTGKAFRIRFLLEFNSGTYYTTSGDIVGWFIDAINFSGVLTQGAMASETLAGTSGSFTPSAGTYLMAVAPLISGREFPAGYQNLTVSEPLSPTFTTWAAGLEASHNLAAGTLSDPHGDPDHDGRCNLMEYAYGGSPTSANDPPERLPVTQVTATHLILRYHVDTSLGDLVVAPQACPTMRAWKSVGEAGGPSGFIDEVISTNGSLQTREARLPLSSGAWCFLRLKVSRQ